LVPLVHSDKTRGTRTTLPRSRPPPPVQDGGVTGAFTNGGEDWKPLRMMKSAQSAG